MAVRHRLRRRVAGVNFQRFETRVIYPPRFGLGTIVSGWTGVPTQVYRLEQTVDNSAGWNTDNPFQLSKAGSIGMRVEGAKTTGSSIRIEREGENSAVLTHGGLLPALPSLSPDELATILARGNPSRPEFEGGVAIGELRDLPRLIPTRMIRLSQALKQSGLAQRRRGSSGPKAGDVYLGITFGIQPMIATVQEMLGLGKALHDRCARLEKSLKIGHQTNNVRLRPGPDRSVAEASYPFGVGLSGLIKGKALTSWEHTSKRWASVRWKPTSLTFRLVKEACQAVSNLGDDPSLRDWVDFVGDDSGHNLIGIGSGSLASTVWELLPFSWLADWCSNVGDAIAATNNTFRFDRAEICVMEQQMWEPHVRFIDSTGEGSFSLGKAVPSTTKARSVVPTTVKPEIALHVPILSGGQFLTLGALFDQIFRS